LEIINWWVLIPQNGILMIYKGFRGLYQSFLKRTNGDKLAVKKYVLTSREVQLLTEHLKLKDAKYMGCRICML
jgi:hypothetical protein